MNESDIEGYSFEISPGIFSLLNNLPLPSVVLLPRGAGHARRHVVSGKRRQREP